MNKFFITRVSRAPTNKANTAFWLIGIVLLLACGAVHAATTYQYTGNGYTSITNSEPPAGIYTTGMNLSGSFTVLAPLNIATDGDISGSVTAYSFNDGRFTLTNSNSQILDFIVTVDVTGDIVSWDILVDDILGATIDEIVSSLGTVSIGDSTFAGVCPEAICDRSSPFTKFDTAVANVSGTWSVVPIPATAWLFSSALGLLGWMRRKAT